MDELIFNRFKIERQLGEGGSSQVFEAFDIRMERKVAIKRIVKKPHTVPRAIREAKTVALLSHPNIVTVHDFIEDDDFFYLVMERIEGIPLDKILQEKRFTCKQAIAAALQVSRALECAHSNNIIHRDIKPSNLILLPDGRIKVVDFGISRLKGSDDLTIDNSNNIVGTMAYISPEQARAEPLDERTDLFSLGIVFYEMLTGENPFRTDTQAATIFKILHSTPDNPSALNPKVPAEIGAIALKLLEKDADDRFDSAVMARYKIDRHAGKIDEQAELRKLINDDNLDTVSKTPNERSRFKLGIDTSTSLFSRFSLGLIGFITAFIMGRSVDLSTVLSLLGGLVILAGSLYIPRLGLLLLLLFCSIVAYLQVWWLGLVVLPILIAYFAATKYQKPFLSFLPFATPILANLFLGFSYPIAVGYNAEKPADVVAPSILGGFILTVYDLFMRDVIRFVSITSPKFGSQNKPILIIVAEIVSKFFKNPILLLQPIIFVLIAFAFSMLKTKKNNKLLLWSVILCIFSFAGFYALALLGGTSPAAAKQLSIQFVVSTAGIVSSSFIYIFFSKIKSKPLEKGSRE